MWLVNAFITTALVGLWLVSEWLGLNRNVTADGLAHLVLRDKRDLRGGSVAIAFVLLGLLFAILGHLYRGSSGTAPPGTAVPSQRPWPTAVSPAGTPPAPTPVAVQPPLGDYSGVMSWEGGPKELTNLWLDDIVAAPGDQRDWPVVFRLMRGTALSRQYRGFLSPVGGVMMLGSSVVVAIERVPGRPAVLRGLIGAQGELTYVGSQQ